MEDPTTTLHAVSSLSGLATIAAGVPLTRYAGRRWVAWPLLALTAAVGGLLIWSALFGGFWIALPNALLGIGLVMLWDHHLGARHARPGPIMLRLTAWRIRRGKAGHRRPDGRRLLTIAELRAEYGQNVLDDATRDPHLDHVLAVYEEHLPELIRGPDNETDLLDITVFANRYLDRLSDPDRPTFPGPPYAGYTHHMLIIAALCRLADQVPTIAVTDPHPAKH
jgi:hypothetical protein